jgi:glycosyltransferase involved in cell wall biosynthesis
MTDISAIVCTHNPNRGHLQRTLEALRAQTFCTDRWELLIVDNASTPPVANSCDLSWHKQWRHVREESLGLTSARMCGLKHASGTLLVFVDDDNVLDPRYLEEAWAIAAQRPGLGVFGAGVLEPEFEIPPPADINPYLQMLALRTVAEAAWSTNPNDGRVIPWGAGLCVTRSVAAQYQQTVATADITSVLDRKGDNLFSGGDDLFSWVAASAGRGFGIFPGLRATHLISADRLTREYFLKLIRDRAFSNSVLYFALTGLQPHRFNWPRYLRLLLRGLRHGRFAMRCQWAGYIGQDTAARFIAERGLQPARLLLGTPQLPRAAS